MLSSLSKNNFHKIRNDFIMNRILNVVVKKDHVESFIKANSINALSELI